MNEPPIAGSTRAPARALTRRTALGQMATAGVLATLAAAGLRNETRAAGAIADTANTQGQPGAVIMSQATPTASTAPTVVLVHGAFADASGRGA